jgi:hypothetical protein
VTLFVAGEIAMPLRFNAALWRMRILSALAQLTLIFVGVTLAFVFEGWRKQLDETADVRQTMDGLIAELRHYEMHGGDLAQRMEQSIEAWQAEDRAGRQAALDLYRIQGAPYAPAAAWNSAVSSGVANRIDPALSLELGWYYSEMGGIHVNYARHIAFHEREVMPRVLEGAAAFYGPDGKLKPEFRVHLALYEEFVADLKRLSTQAGELRRKLEALRATM